MNCTSAAETGGSVAFVVEGKALVGFPGAPGWTTAGVVGEVCCAQTAEGNKLARVLIVTSANELAARPNLRGASPLNLRWRGSMYRMYLIIVGFTLPHLTVT